MRASPCVTPTFSCTDAVAVPSAAYPGPQLSCCGRSMSLVCAHYSARRNPQNPPQAASRLLWPAA